jgi:hypothetical protein
MLNRMRVFVDAALAIAIMLVLSIISGFLAAAVTGDRATVVATMGAAFVIAGGGLLLRVWLLAPKPGALSKPEA